MWNGEMRSAHLISPWEPTQRISLGVNLPFVPSLATNGKLTQNTSLHISGGRSHFFRLRLRSCSKIFQFGSGSGNSSILRIRPLFGLRLQSLI